ncbi:MAG: hypothetical protein QOI55_2412, partial [Actinomycetota bacterium]|nr:hypothetical protein [Actinomycetota bacterium]
MATNGSFRDPVGLVRRMMAAREPAARSALVRAALEVAAKPLDGALQRRERRLVAEAPHSDQPLLFIVGPPRSGSTIVYQTIVRRLPVSYATNLSSLFPRAPISAQELLGRRKTACRDVRSYFGQTRGLLDANDAFHLWDRWLGSERYRAPARIPEASVRDMRRFFDVWRSRFPAPFVNKNNRNTDCLRQLADALPEARFVVVRRDPLATLQSLLIARRVVQGDVRIGWGLRSRDAEGDGPFAAAEAVCDQLAEIEQRLRADCSRVAPSRLVEVSYEQFCAA